MAVDMFIKVGNIKGESLDKAHKEEIDVLAWSWGLSQSGTMHMGTGGGAGKASVQDLTFTKHVDKATTTIMLVCAKGSRHPAIQATGSLTFTPAGLTPAEHASLRWTHNSALSRVSVRMEFGALLKEEDATRANLALLGRIT